MVAGVDLWVYNAENFCVSFLTKLHPFSLGREENRKNLAYLPSISLLFVKPAQLLGLKFRRDFEAEVG